MSAICGCPAGKCFAATRPGRIVDCRREIEEAGARSATPATPDAPGGEVELLERAARLLETAHSVGHLGVEVLSEWLRDYRRLRDGK